jgi:hypothetical protein
MGDFKYISFENFDHFWLIIFYGDKNIKIRTRSFSSCFDTPYKIFHPDMKHLKKKNPFDYDLKPWWIQYNSSL